MVFRNTITFLHLEGKHIESVTSFKYLRRLIIEDLELIEKSSAKLNARFFFDKMRSFFCDDSLNLTLR